MSPSNPRARGLIASGTLSLAVFGAAPVGVPAQTPAAPAPAAAPAAAPSVSVSLRHSHVRYGTDLVATGRVRNAAPGAPVVLEHRPSGGSWSEIGRATPKPSGSYRVEGDVARNGAVRVTLGSPSASLRASSATAAAPASRAVSVRVAPKVSTTHVGRHVNAGRTSVVRGRVLPARAGRTVRLLVRSGGKWRTVDRDTTSEGGAYRVTWKTKGAGRATVRVRVSSDRSTTATRRTLGRVNVYRSGHASYYGPGLYGGRTACGQTLTPGLVGVAHRSLPCGTKVTFRYRGRTATIRVVDRGPFVAGREWDLTAAAKQRLGFGSTGTVRTTS